MNAKQLFRTTQRICERRGEAQAASEIAATLKHSSPAGQLHTFQLRARALREQAKQAVAEKPFDKKRVAALLEQLRGLNAQMDHFIGTHQN